MYNISFWPILVASLVGFGISSLWYSPILFGKEWMRLLKISDKNIYDMKASSIWIRYVIQFIITLITFSILAFAYSILGLENSSDGAFLGFFVWLGFMIPIFISELLWKKESIKLASIDAINNLIILVLGGAIIGAWR